jgi:spore maturation protein CgeB
MRIAFLSSIYPAHAEKIYRENPSLKNKPSDEQMDVIRWHALSSYTKWNEYLTERGFNVLEFHHNLPHVELKWAEENQFCHKKENEVFQIGIEKIKRFKPDILYCSSPLFYTRSNFLKELIDCLPQRPQLVSWYGANCGDEEIFRFFDLTLSNSKYLINSLRKKKISADLLPHSFEPAILEKINIPEKRINKLGFFGNLDTYTPDFENRNKLLLKISDVGNILQVYGTAHKPKPLERLKYSTIKSRHIFSRSLSGFLPLAILKKWSQTDNLPPSPWPLEKTFSQKVKPPLFGQEMLQTLSNYQIAFNYHNKHTGDNACNMRLFEATGVGCCLLTEQKSDICSIFEPESEIVTYSSPEEAISKAQYLIKAPKFAEKIALAGQKRTLTDYTSEKQIDHLVFQLENLYK